MARTPPSSGYLEPEDHPASTTAYTASDDMASTKRSPTLRSATCRVTSVSPTWKGRPTGIIRKIRKAGAMAAMGAAR